MKIFEALFCGFKLTKVIFDKIGNPKVEFPEDETSTDLHDVVSLVLFVEVGPGELQGVVERGGGGDLDRVARLVSPHAMNDGCQDVIGRLLQEPVVHIIADVSNSGERALLHHLGAGGVGHVLDQGCDESWPQCSRYLHSSDHVDTLSSSAGSEALSAQSSHHILLGVGADVLGNVEPPLLVLSLQGLVVGVEEVLELDSGLLSAHCTVPSMIQDIRQSPTSRF